MRHIYQFVFLLLFISYSFCDFQRKYYSNRTSNSSSRSIYELVQLRRNAARLAKLHRNNQTYTADSFSYNARTIRTKIYRPEDLQQEFVVEPLKATVILSGIAIGSMIIIVILCIVFRYICYVDSCREILVDSATARELKTRSTQYTYECGNSRNFQRKERQFQTAL